MIKEWSRCPREYQRSLARPQTRSIDCSLAELFRMKKIYEELNKASVRSRESGYTHISAPRKTYKMCVRASDGWMNV